MSEQIDIAVDLGVAQPPLPEIEFLREFAANVPEAPPQIVEGILRLGSKMIIGAYSMWTTRRCPAVRDRLEECNIGGRVSRASPAATQHAVASCSFRNRRIASPEWAA